ncbi:MAG TPA: POTRA domain-containing protein [Terriglobales bacterium]|nr:POTRA domain-containing protein [Terriglobales bacterium]
MAVIVVAVLLSAASVWSQPQSSRTSSESPSGDPAQESACFGAFVDNIHIPEINEKDEQMLKGMLSVHEGTHLDREELQESMRILFGTGRFAEVRAECNRTGEGHVDLTFQSTPNFFIGLVSVEGAPGRPTQSQIVNASKLQLGEIFTQEKLDAAVLNIGRLLEENEYYRGVVSHSEHKIPETQQIEISFHVHSGDPAHIGAVTLTGEPGISVGELEDIAHLHPGEVVTAQKISDALDRIRKHYQKRDRWLAQVAISKKEYVRVRNAVDYTFSIDVGPRVEIRADGFRISKGTLRRNVPVYEEHALDDDLLNEGRRNLLSYMESHGYFDAKVELRRETDPQTQVLRVIYQIDPGERHKVMSVQIAGNKYFRQNDLRPLLHVQPASLALTHGRYSQALLQGDLRDIENMYRANGFQQVKIETQVDDNYHGKKNQLAIKIEINEGPQTRVGTFQIEGSTQLDNPTFQNLYTGPGQPFSDSRIAEDRDIILNYYFDSGFLNASFEAAATPAAGNRMNVVFKIQEGPRTYVDRVLVSGREFTRAYVIDHELQMRSGDPLSQGDLLRTQQKLYDLGIFSQVDTAVQDPEGTETSKNVLVQVQEAKRYTFNYGGGFEFQTGQPAANGKSSLGTNGVSPLASLDVSRLNFRGRNHTITFESRVGRLQQRGLISYDAPRWFNNPNWKLTLTGFFDHTLDVTTFTSQRLEGSVQAEQLISQKLDGTPVSVMNYRFNYRLVKATDIQVSQDLIPLLSLPVRVGEPGFSYIRDHRDNDLQTTRGTYNTVDAGVASSYFGSQADFGRILLQNSSYYPFGRVNGRQFVFARSTRIGLEKPFANTIITQPGQESPADHTLIPLAERFYMGGGNSHRGFGLNQAGPRDPTTGFPTGGSALFLNNLELRFPPPTLPFVQDNLSFAIFHDMGNVFTDGNHMLDSLLRWHQNKNLCTQAPGSTFQVGANGTNAALCNYNYISHAIGLGMLYKTPVGPVRFDFGYNLNPTVFPGVFQVSNNPVTYQFKDTKQVSPFNFYFSIGQTF